MSVCLVVVIMIFVTITFVVVFLVMFWVVMFVVVFFFLVFAVIVHDQGVVFLVLFQQQLWSTAMVAIDEDCVFFIACQGWLEGVGNEKYKQGGDGQVEQNFFGGEHCVLVGGGFGLILCKLVLALVVALLCWFMFEVNNLWPTVSLYTKTWPVSCK